MYIFSVGRDVTALRNTDDIVDGDVTTMRIHLKRVALLLLPAAMLYVFVSLFISEQQRLIDGDGAEQQNKHIVAQKPVWQIGFPALWKTRPDHDDHEQLWPNELNQYDDRIIKQMKFIPKSYQQQQQQQQQGSKSDDVSHQQAKIIYAPGGLGETPSGMRKFRLDECPVSRCLLTGDSAFASTAHVILYQNGFFNVQPRLPHQIWVMWLLESPFHTGDLSEVKSYVNWTATYRTDSTIVTPYERFVHYDNFTALPTTPLRNYAQGKTHMVAWFVSNCISSNKRSEYVTALEEHVKVDIYGACGTHVCPRHKKEECNDILRIKYKFYLAFENSNCVHYITEKFYWNALL